MKGDQDIGRGRVRGNVGFVVRLQESQVSHVGEQRMFGAGFRQVIGHDHQRALAHGSISLKVTVYALVAR